MPTVSFLMSNYRTPTEYLRRALDSVLAQTFRDFEVVIINDGVKDESYDVLLEYAALDQRIRVIENEKNLGLPASLNRGLGFCIGKYIARMDTDDICYPDRLEVQVNYMESHPDVMFAGAWADVFEDDENSIIKTWKYRIPSNEEYRIRLLFANDPILIHPTVIFRRNFLIDNELEYSEDPDYRYTEDYEMWTRCADRGNAAIIERVVLKYRVAQTNDRITVRHAEEMAQCCMNTQKKLFRRLGIDFSEEDYKINWFMLSGRKPYDILYKKWIKRLIRQNRALHVYDRGSFETILHERWYSIVYYGIAYEKSSMTRFSMFVSLFPREYLRFIKELLHKRMENKS